MSNTKSIFGEYEQLDAVGLAEYIRKHQIPPQDVLEAAKAVISKKNPTLNALVSTTFDYAATSIHQGLENGSLHGVPFLLKDIGSPCQGIPTTFGSEFFGPISFSEDWAYVSRLKQAGVIFTGVTNTCELGLGLSTEPKIHGPTLNPWNLTKTPGGSSGGAAAAVISGMAPIAYGGDAFGSIRGPASCCGVVGLKPSVGLNSLGPKLPQLMSGLVSIGILSRTVRDQAAVLDVTSGKSLGDLNFAPGSQSQDLRSGQTQSSSYLERLKELPASLKIAVYEDVSANIHPECQRAVEATAQICESLGHEVSLVKSPIDLELTRALFEVFASVDTAAALAAHPLTGKPAQEHQVEPLTWEVAQRGKNISAVALVQAEFQKHQFAHHMETFLHEFDILMTPTLAQPPVDLGWLEMSTRDVDEYWNRTFEFSPFSVPFNLSGQPAISLPLSQSQDGLPIGVQLVAAHGRDALLLQLSHQLEHANPWQQRTIPAFD